MNWAGLSVLLGALVVAAHLPWVGGALLVFGLVLLYAGS